MVPNAPSAIARRIRRSRRAGSWPRTSPTWSRRWPAPARPPIARGSLGATWQGYDRPPDMPFDEHPACALFWPRFPGWLEGVWRRTTGPASCAISSWPTWHGACARDGGLSDALDRGSRPDWPAFSQSDAGYGRRYQPTLGPRAPTQGPFSLGGVVAMRALIAARGANRGARRRTGAA
jgi:hypothetical protein